MMWVARLTKRTSDAKQINQNEYPKNNFISKMPDIRFENFKTRFNSNPYKVAFFMIHTSYIYQYQVSNLRTPLHHCSDHFERFLLQRIFYSFGKSLARLIRNFWNINFWIVQIYSLWLYEGYSYHPQISP